MLIATRGPLGSKIFENRELVPPTWLERAGEGQVHVFNPAILRVRDGLVMAYRVVLPDDSRHIAMCRLNEDWTVPEGSVSPVSDMLTYADAGEVDDDYHARPADPRLFGAGDRLYMHFNCGSRPRPNRIYLVEIDLDLLRPVGRAREVVRIGRRQTVEKNWLFFAHGEDVFAIYRLAPLTISRVDLSDPRRVVCTDAYCHDWNAWAYQDTYGELRGGATPVMHDGRYVVIAHSVFAAEPDQTGMPGDGDLCYVGAVCVLDGAPPFAPALVSSRPAIELTPAEQALPHRPRLDPRCVEAAYPDGAVADQRGLTVSYGVNERYAAVRHIDWADLFRALVPAIPCSPRLTQARAWLGADGQSDGGSDVIRLAEQGGLALRAFWWQPRHISPRPGPPDTGLMRDLFIHGNFGDLSVPHLLGRLTGLSPGYHENGPRLLSVGSILQIARDQDVIWGTGVNGARPEMIHAPRRLHVYATRGPVSCDFLRRHGFDVSRVTAMFDPVSLIGHLFADEIAMLRRHIGNQPRDFILIPHYRDDLLMRRLYPRYEDRIRSADTPFFEMASEILRSDLVISSSLHGLILAEVLGVPAVWHRPLAGEDELKFIDYYLGTGRYKIVRSDTIQAAFKATPMALPTFDAAAMLATFPSPRDLEAHGVLAPLRPIEVNRAFSFAAVPPDGVCLLDGWSRPESHGVWSNQESATLELFIGEDAAADLVVALAMTGYVPAGSGPQRVTVSDGIKVLGSFEIAHAGPVDFRVTVAEAMLDQGMLRLIFTIPTAVSPASLGRGSDTRRLGVALSTLRLLASEP